VSGLFRAEAVQAVQSQWLGRVQIAQPPALRWLALGAVVAVLAVGAFLGTASYTRKAAVPGVLAPEQGLIRLMPAAAGTVVERHVAEGDAVRSGQLLFTLAQDRFSRDDAMQGTVDRAVDAQRRQLEDVVRQQRALGAARDRALALRLEALAAEHSQMTAELGLQSRRLDLARQSLQRLQALQAQAYVSEAQVQARQEDMLALEAQVQALSRQQATLGRERAELEGERATLPAQRDSAIAQVGSQLAELSRDGAELQAVRRIEVRAPQDGTVHGLLAGPGQSVAPPAALATLLPAGATLQAQLYAPSRTIGFVRPGQVVRLRLEAYPHARYGHLEGRVLRVDRVPLAAAEQASLPLPVQPPGAEPLFRITVALDAVPPEWAERPLGAGLRLQADVMLERRRLIEWVFEPLLGVASRL
jgi:membrane fusion protein